MVTVLIEALFQFKTGSWDYGLIVVVQGKVEVKSIFVYAIV